MLNLLILTGEDMDRIDEVITYAKENVLYMDDLLDVKNKARPAPCDMPEYCAMLSIGLKCLYTEFVTPKGLYKSLCLSLPMPNKVVEPEVGQFFVELFGLKKPVYGEVDVYAEGYESLTLMDLPEAVREEIGLEKP